MGFTKSIGSGEKKMIVIEENLENRWRVKFFTIWTGQAISLITSELIQFSLIWWLTVTTGSATVLAIATMIALLPKALLGPLIGALLDRWNRKVVLIISDVGIAISLVFLVISFSTDLIQVWHIYMVILIRALGGAFHMSAMLTTTPLLVPKKNLTKVAGLNQMISGIVMVVVPPLGAVLLNLMSISNILILDIGGAIIAIVPLFFIKISQQKNKTSLIGAKTLWMDVKEGFNYIKHWQGATGMLVISTFINFIMRPAFSLIAILVTVGFNKGEVEFGWMGASLGAGFLLGGLVLSVWGGFLRKMQTSLTAIVGAGIAIFIVSLAATNTFGLGLIAIFIAGFMMPLCMGPIEALIQSTVDPFMQGRVFSIMKSASTIISPLSLAIAGIIFDTFGPFIWYRWGGILAVIIGILGFTKSRILNFGVQKLSSCTSVKKKSKKHKKRLEK